MEAKLIMEGVSQEWGVGSELEVEGQGLTEVLPNLLLGCEMEMAIGTRDLDMRYTTHRLDILKSVDGMECGPGLLSSQDMMADSHLTGQGT